MLNSMFSIEGFNPNGAQEGFEDECSVKQTQLFTTEDVGNVVVDDFWSIYSFNQESQTDKGTILPSSVTESIPEFIPPQTPLMVFETNLENPIVQDITEFVLPKKKSCTGVLSSLEILNSYKPCHNRLQVGNLNEEIVGFDSNSLDGEMRLSTEEIVKFAAARYIELSSPTEGDNSMLRNPLGLSLSGFNNEEIQNVELASLLLAAAEKVSNQQYDRASNLLRQCETFSSHCGNPVQRLVYYFSDALQERIDRETGRLSAKRPRDKGIPAEDAAKEMLASHPIHLITQKTLPFSQVIQFTSIQTILDNVATMKRIHLVNLSIKHGFQCTILMQALATRSSCPVDYLRITGVGASKEAVLVTGQRLVSFAETLSLPFDFRVVAVSDMKDLREDMFEIEPDEALAVYSSLDMNSMIVRPKSLENLIRVMRKLKPIIMMIIDLEANHNSPSFITRFTEALFFYSTYFDYVDCYLDRSDSNRTFLEGYFFAEGMRSIIVTEGSERLIRHVSISIWRAYFARFGLVEVDLNEWASYQASLLLKKFPHSSSCTLDKNGKSLTVGWKGTPLYFISAWKFQYGD
ncbi:Transcription factor GRAS domain-containing protein [Dioscorea alata]|uniref:Transcription factor GRAS domain-containing protein n=1 Tax=Dioscorea alata TaxID=55571 RepID=A0ACB7V059_DIOAL|nr:Transcription factor GRAS domain-containing protein [Dioscorea alata]